VKYPATTGFGVGVSVGVGVAVGVGVTVEVRVGVDVGPAAPVRSFALFEYVDSLPALTARTR
jgi:hypothetical protein